MKILIVSYYYLYTYISMLTNLRIDDDSKAFQRLKLNGSIFIEPQLQYFEHNNLLVSIINLMQIWTSFWFYLCKCSLLKLENDMLSAEQLITRPE